MRRVPAPPRPSRALLIAALAHAGAILARPMAPSRQSLSPSRIERRAVSLRAIARNFGQAIIAAGRAHARFLLDGSAAPPPALVAMDARLHAIIASTEIAALIGQPQLMPASGLPAAAHDDGAPWVSLAEDPPRLSIMWRGQIIHSDRMTGARPAASSRLISAEAFAAAIKAAARALDAAGFPTNGLIEVRELRIGAQQQARVPFEGLVATIGLRRQRAIA